MKRPMRGAQRAALTAATMVLAIAGLTGPAHAEGETTLHTRISWGGTGDSGNPLTIPTSGNRLVVAYRFHLMPALSCTGTGCELDRPARLEIMRQGAWTTWASGTLGTLADSTKVLTSKRRTTTLVRSVLPAHGSLPEVTSQRQSIRWLPGTSVAVSGPTVIAPSPGNPHTWQFRAGPGSVTISVAPASAGRIVELRDAGILGHPLIGTATTNSRGRATVSADFSGVAVLLVTVRETSDRAGWYIDATPAP